MPPKTIKENNFIVKPKIGSIVKVYISKTEYLYGVVVDYFCRMEHSHEYNYNNKTVPACDCTTECVLLKGVENVPFDNINYFLDKSRVDFKID